MSRLSAAQRRFDAESDEGPLDDFFEHLSGLSTEELRNELLALQDWETGLRVEFLRGEMVDAVKAELRERGEHV